MTASLLRPQLYEWLGVEGQDVKVLEHAEALAKAYRADRSAVAPELAEVALSLAARRGDRAMFEDHKRRFETAQVPAERQLALQALGSFRDPALMEEALRYALSGHLRPNEVFSIPLGMGDSPKNQDLTFRWLMKNHAEILKLIPPMAASFLPFSAGGCSAERLKEGQAFFSDPAHAPPGTERSLAKVVDQVQDCLALRQREGENVAKYLLEQAATN